MTERVAAIDCGTNSIRLLVTDVTDDGRSAELVREMQIVRLGQDVDATGRLASEAIERTLAATREYVETISSLGADRVRFCATSAARDASNADEFLSAVEEIVGVRPEILTGAEEAKASFIGATRGLGSAGEVLVVDIGGGSTELVVGREADVAWSTSLDIGSVRMTERFLLTDPPTSAEVEKCSAYLREALGDAASSLTPVRTLVGVAGTITTVAAHALDLPGYDRSAIHGARLTIEQTRTACASLAEMSVAERRALPFMHPGRADVIGGGALILDAVLTSVPLTTNELIVSEHDILDGLALA